MAELWTYTTPQAVGMAASVQVVGIEIHTHDLWILRITLKDDEGRRTDYYYRDAEARAIIVGINKANLATQSLERILIKQLVKDGRLAAGSITGSPD